MILGTRLGFGVIKRFLDGLGLADIVTSHPVSDIIVPGFHGGLMSEVGGKTIRYQIPMEAPYHDVVLTNILSGHAIRQIPSAIDRAIIQKGIMEPIFLPLAVGNYAGLTPEEQLDLVAHGNKHSPVNGELLNRILEYEFARTDFHAHIRAWTATRHIADVMGLGLSYLLSAVHEGEFRQATKIREWSDLEKEEAKGTTLFIMRARGLMEEEIAKNAEHDLTVGHHFLTLGIHPEIKIYRFIADDFPVGLFGPVLFISEEDLLASSPMKNDGANDVSSAREAASLDPANVIRDRETLEALLTEDERRVSYFLKMLEDIQDRMLRPIVRGTGWIRLTSERYAKKFYETFVSDATGYYTATIEGTTIQIPAAMREKMISWAKETLHVERTGLLLIKRF